MIAFSHLVEKIDFVIPWPQISVYKLYAQVARLTTLCIEFSMKIPTIWYIATLVPLGVQRILFLPGSSKGLKNFILPHMQVSVSVRLGQHELAK